MSETATPPPRPATARRNVGRHRSPGARKVAVLGVALALVVAACSDYSTQPSTGSPGGSAVPATALTFNQQKVPVTAPGVSDTEIRVGGIVSVAGNPVSSKYGTAFDGVQAYFDMVNAQGGIYGRKLVLADQLDDKLVNNTTEAQRLIGGGNTFSVLPVATPLFTGADALVAAGMPTFGWDINTEWGGTPEQPKSNLFGQAGSALCVDCAVPFTPWLAQQAGRHKIGLLAYNVPQSAGCATGTENSFAKYGKEAGAEIAFSDKSLAFGVQDLSVQVQKLKEAGADFIYTCMDTNAVVTLARESKKQGLDAIQLLPNGYDFEFLKEYGDLFEGSFVRTDFVGLEAQPQPAGNQRFTEWMAKAGKPPTENAIVGWLNADLFVTGLQAAGPNFSQKAVIDAINKMTAYSSSGQLQGVNWTTAHTVPGKCQYVSKIEDSKFTPNYGATPEKPFVCPGEDGGKLVGNPMASSNQ